MPKPRNLIRELLIKALGGACDECGQDDPDVLEVDHVEGRTWYLRGLNSRDRWARYAREWLEGVSLRLLCRTHNARHLNRPGAARYTVPRSSWTARAA